MSVDPSVGQMSDIYAHNSQDTMEYIVTSEQVYIQAIECTQFLHSIFNCYNYFVLSTLPVRHWRAYSYIAAAFSSSSHVILTHCF